MDEELQLSKKDKFFGILKLIYAISLVLFGIIAIVSGFLYQIINFHVYYMFLISGFFLFLLFCIPTMMLIYLIFWALWDDIKNRKKKNDRSFSGALLFGTFCVSFFAYFVTPIFFNSLMDLPYIFHPQVLVFYEGRIEERRDVGRAILQQGQILIAKDEEGNTYEIFLGKGNETTEFISKIEVNYLPHTKMAKSYDVKSFK